MNLRFCVATKKLIETPEGVHFALLGGAGQKKGGAARGLDRATPDLQLSEITRKGDFFVWIESLSGSGFLERFHTKNFSYTGRKPRLDVTIKRSKT